MKTIDVIMLCIAVACFLLVLIPEVIKIYKMFFGENVTFIKKNGERLTVPRKYDKETSKKIIEFLNKD